MSENLDQQTSAQSPQPEFVSLVQQALENKQVKPKCFCGAIGWASFEIFPVPTVTPTLVQNVVLYSAVIHCLKCGLKMERNLTLLGITVQQQERRVLTPAEIQKPLIVTE